MILVSLTINYGIQMLLSAGPDPGFSVGGRGPILGGFWPPTWALFSENVCENERIGPCRGGVRWHAPPRSAYYLIY